MRAFEDLLHEAMMVSAELCLPVLVVAAAAGLIVAVAQAATQIQEQTLSVLPKVVVVGCVLAMFGSAGLRACAALFHEVIGSIPAIVFGP